MEPIAILSGVMFVSIGLLMIVKPSLALVIIGLILFGVGLYTARFLNAVPTGTVIFMLGFLLSVIGVVSSHFKMEKEGTLNIPILGIEGNKLYSSYIRLGILILSSIPSILIVLFLYTTGITYNMSYRLIWIMSLLFCWIVSVSIFIKILRFDAKNVRLIGSGIFSIGFLAYSLLLYLNSSRVTYD